MPATPVCVCTPWVFTQSLAVQLSLGSTAGIYPPHSPCKQTAPFTVLSPYPPHTKVFRESSPVLAPTEQQTHTHSAAGREGTREAGASLGIPWECWANGAEHPWMLRGCRGFALQPPQEFCDEHLLVVLYQ